MVAVLVSGVLVAVYGGWQWARAVHLRPPHARRRRRGQIGCVSGSGASVLALTFALTPQHGQTAALIAWGIGAAVIWLFNEYVWP